uniref:UDP-N-acetylglucosamine--peptide N-acetylglucosaminyltransferase SPINDLY n=1 Tax=Araucaria cunninghamii TaxID=56994 RepID=A0A0D6R803_ARACU
MVDEKAIVDGGGSGGEVPQSESKNVETAEIENPVRVSPSSPAEQNEEQQKIISCVMNAKNPAMDQNSSQSSPQHGNSNSSREVVSLVNDFQSLGVPGCVGSAQQEALQQQALHQAALHQQALQQHGIPPLAFHSLLRPTTAANRLCPTQHHSDKRVKCEAEAMDVCDSCHVDKSRKGREVIEIEDGKSRSKQEAEEEEEREDESVKAEAEAEVECCSTKQRRRGRASEGVFADLNAEPPMSDGDEDGDGDEASPSGGPDPKIAAVQEEECGRSTTDEKRKKKNLLKVKNIVKDIEEENKKIGKPVKARQKLKGDPTLESGHDTDADQQYQGVSAAHEEKIRSLKAGLVHVARKMPKNAHAHFVLGLMYQRLGQPMKAVTAFEKSTEILRQSEEETGQSRLQLLSLLQIHHAQCLLQGSVGDHCLSDKDLQEDEIEDMVSKLRESVQGDDRYASVWNTLGLLLLRTGHVQGAVSILSSLLSIVPDYLDALTNLGVAYLHSGNLEYAARCFQALLGKDKNHPGGLLNYGANLLRQYGSTVAGPGAHGSQDAYASQLAAANAAQQCLGAAVKTDSKAGYMWVNLAAAYSLAGDHMSAGRCLEQASKLEPNRMSIRYAIAVHRVRDAERSKDPTQQLSWAANEMASILRESDPGTIKPCLAWAGLAMVDRAQHETAAAFEGETDLKEVEERALYTLQQAIEEDPGDFVQWHQLGLHTLCTLQFKEAESYLKTAIALRKDCSFAWSNLGVALQLSGDPSLAEEVYKRALSLAASDQAHTALSNLGNLYRQQKRFDDARHAFTKALEICPSYAPACNNLGLLYIAEGRWQKAISCFDQALLSDPLLDAAKSNKMKAVALSSLCYMNGDSDSPMSTAILNSPETPLDLASSADAQVSHSMRTQENAVVPHERVENDHFH